MARTSRNPDGSPLVRLTIYIDPATKAVLDQIKTIDTRSFGQIVDEVFRAVGLSLLHGETDTVAIALDAEPRLDTDVSNPVSIAGQPGVEHRRGAASGGIGAPRRRSTKPVRDVVSAVIDAPKWKDHPGWRLNSMGQNVCTDCGRTKSRSKGLPCQGPK